MPQLRDEWEGHDASLEGFPAMEVFAELDALLDLDDALVDEDLRHPHGEAPRRLLPVDDVVPRSHLLARRVLLYLIKYFFLVIQLLEQSRHLHHIIVFGSSRIHRLRFFIPTSIAKTLIFKN